MRRSPSYLIEFRFFGQVKSELRYLIYEVDKKFSLGFTRRRHPVPHVSLAGPFKTNKPRNLIRDFKTLCNRWGLMSFTIEGFGTFEDTGVVFINIIPSKELDTFRWQLSETLRPYCSLQPYDLLKKFEYHATVARALPPHKFKNVRDFVHSQKPYNQNYFLSRITLLRNGKILQEYDFLQKKMLSRKQALSRQVGQRTKELLYEQLNERGEKEELPIDFSIQQKKKTFLQKIREMFTEPIVFVTSDHHFDHQNIIKYCGRPFKNLKIMNGVLMENWNTTIRKKDRVFYLGDLSYGRSSRKTSYWLKRLNGKVTYIQGNHDLDDNEMLHDLEIEYGGVKFLLVHSPSDIPKGHKGWVIHGHRHNNKPKDSPFINYKTKRVNVSVELTSYLPVPLDEIVWRIKEYERHL